MRLKIKSEIGSTVKLRLVWLCIIILVGVGVFVWLRGKKEGGKVLARVGNTVLSETEFYALIPSEYAGRLTLSQKKELLKKWIDTELVYQAGLKEGLHKERELQAKLRQIEQEVIANEFLTRYLAKIGSVAESDVRAYFDSHISEYTSERRAARILVLDREQANAVVSRLREGADFSDVAREYSVDPSAQQDGGVMGYIRRGDMPQLFEFEAALFSLNKVGDISEPVQTNYGYYIIKLLDVRELTEEVQYEDVREKVRAFLDFSKRKQAFVSLLDNLRKGKNIVANYELLE